MIQTSLQISDAICPDCDKVITRTESVKDTEFGFSLNHMSNGDISEKNPGTDNYMFNFLKKF